MADIPSEFQERVKKLAQNVGRNNALRKIKEARIPSDIKKILEDQDISPPIEPRESDNSE